MLNFECPKDIAKKRVLARNDTSREDNEQLFEERYAAHLQDNPAILEFYHTKGILTTVSRSNCYQVVEDANFRKGQD